MQRNFRKGCSNVVNAGQSICILALAWFGAAPHANLSASERPLTAELVAAGLELPVFLTAAPGDEGRLFVVEQPGRIRIIKDGALLVRPFLDIRAQVGSGGECGLLGLAFHPNYNSNGLFYVDYTDQACNTVIARFQVSADPDIAAADSETNLLTIEQPFANHNGGMLAFGPRDGYLYIGMGDGGSANDPGDRAQNLGEYHGKLLRIDVDSGSPYAIPPENPFVGVPGVRPEIWAYGMRNPWRFSFDRANGDLYIGDVGQAAREEIDFQPAASRGGENYGWDIAEGFACAGGAGACGTNPGFTPPIYDYAHSLSSSASVTGGYVYRGRALPEYLGIYFFADFVTGAIWSLRWNGAAITELRDRTSELEPAGAAALNNIGSFGEDAAGELYLVDYDGEVFRITGRNFGDLNRDGFVDAVDVQLIINAALGIDVGDIEADVNQDNTLTAVDVQLVINRALGLV
ncbi:MAG: PQQ-dependent sugar dehydrogenase [Candidatus Hydrogenedentes bacterium]|nr:PQQ-dependent sugar dehydrogenase [Candidatus Hydrogenedentota bacterium]